MTFDRSYCMRCGKLLRFVAEPAKGFHEQTGEPLFIGYFICPGWRGALERHSLVRAGIDPITRSQFPPFRDGDIVDFDPIHSDEGQNDPLERSRQEYEEQFLGEPNDDEPDKYPF